MPHQGPYVQPGDTLEDFLRYFWQSQIATAEREEPDFKHPPLPLARIKKVMKNDPEVKVRDAAFVRSRVSTLTSADHR
jgi:hypothetical protein